MKNYFIVFCLFVLFVIGACTDTKGKKTSYEGYEKSDKDTEFDTVHHYIIFKEVRNHDLVGKIYTNIDLNNPQKLIYGCRLQIYNYGDDIKLFNGFVDDFFSEFIGTINYVHSIDENDNIFITSKEKSKKYGEWGLADVNIQGTTVNDVFITPLAMKAYNKGDRYCLNFIQLVNGNYYMNILLNGEPDIGLIIRMKPELIISQDHHNADISTPRKGPGRFWHK